MNKAKGLVEALQMHYSTSKHAPKYGQKMAMSIVDTYAWMSERYAEMLLREVVRTFEPTSTRPLPDLAAIAKAEKALPDPAMIARPAAESREKLERTDTLIRERVNAKAKEDGEVNHVERQRVREKMRRGEATKWEVRWITAIDKYGGDWGRAMRELGPIEGVQIRPAKAVRSAEDEAEVHW